MRDALSEVELFVTQQHQVITDTITCHDKMVVVVVVVVEVIVVLLWWW